MRTTDVYIAGVGSHLPRTVTTEWAVAQGLYDPFERELHQLRGTAVADGTSAPEMALEAGRTALGRAELDGEDLGLLLYAATWHQGPEGWLPHSYLQHHLVGGVRALEVRQGCNGMFTAMELATWHLRAEPGRGAALLVAADNYGSPMVDRWAMGRGYIGGDAASALVLRTEPGFARLRSVCTATVPEAEEMHRGSAPLFPPGITDGRGLDFGRRNEEFQTTARGRPGGTVPLLMVQQQTLAVVETALEEAGIGHEDVTRVAFMNYSREVVEQRCTAALGLPMSRSVWDFGADIGHCGASDQVLALDHLLDTGGLGPGDHLLMMGVGPGVMVAAAVVEILHTPGWVA